jgi:hypothetical protein
MTTPRTLELEIPGKTVKKAYLHYIAADPAQEVGLCDPHCFDPRTVEIEGDTVILPPASVAAIVLEC